MNLHLSRQLGADLGAEAEECAFGEVEGSGFEVGDDPFAAQFGFGERDADELAGGDFGAGGPISGDGDAQAEFGEFLDGFGAAELDEIARPLAEAAEVVADHFKRVAAPAGDDVGLAAEVAGFWAGSGPRVERADQELEFVGENRVAAEQPAVERFEAEPEVEVVGLELGDGFRGGAGGDGDAEERERFLEFAQHGGQHELGGGGGGADAELAARRLVEGAEAGPGLAHAALDGFGVGQELATVVGEEDAAALAVEERAAEVGFERADGVADGGLGQVERLAGAGEAALARQHGEGAKLTKAVGSGRLFLAEGGKRITLLKLEGDGVTVNGNDLLAFQDGIEWDIRMTRKLSGMVAGGLFNLQLKGHGLIALTTHGRPLTLRVARNLPVFTDPNATVAWSSNLEPEFKTDISLRTLIGRTSGESVQMAFSGDGFVVVQPYEEQPFQARR